MNIEDLLNKRTEMVKEQVLNGAILCLGWSGGKDSTCALIIAVEGYRQASEEALHQNKQILPFHVISTDTLIENPAVMGYHKRLHKQLEAYALQNDLDIRAKFLKPNLASSFAVKVIGGRALPTWASSASRDCSHDYKVLPSRRFLKNLPDSLMSELDELTGTNVIELQEKITKEKPIVILGTRFGESTGRDARMTERGDVAGEITVDENNNELTWPLIADFDLTDVWEVLALSGTDEDRPLDGFAPNFDETVAIYRDAQGGECVIVSGMKGQGASCGSRFGCWGCTVSGNEDKSMDAMLADPRYAYMQGLADLRNYLAAIRYDWTKRRWAPRASDKETGYLRYQPDTLHPNECRDLLAYCLTIDVREIERAERLERELDLHLSGSDILFSDPYLSDLQKQGNEVDLAYAQEMKQRQFKIISTEAMVAIDFFWSRYGFHKPFEALALAIDVYENGKREDVPVIEPVERTPQPQARWVDPGKLPETITGLFNPTLSMVSFNQEDGHLNLKDGSMMTPHETAPSFQIDTEALGYLLDFDLPYLMRQYRNGRFAYHASAAAEHYLRNGIVILAKGKSRETNEMVKHHQILHNIDHRPDAFAGYPEGSISDREFRDIKTGLGHKMVQIVPNDQAQIEFGFMEVA